MFVLHVFGHLLFALKPEVFAHATDEEQAVRLGAAVETTSLPCCSRVVRGEQIARANLAAGSLQLGRQFNSPTPDHAMRFHS